MAAATGTQAVEEMDYYELLGLRKDATPSQIKKAYMKKARAWHPDKNDASKKAECEKMFKAISEAYDCLRDPESRSQYDRFGRAGVRDGGGSHGHHFSFAEADEMFRQFASMFGQDSPFEAMFGGVGGGASSGMPAGHGSGSSSRATGDRAHPFDRMFADMDRMMGAMHGGMASGMGSSFSMSSSSSSSTSASPGSLGSGAGSSRVVGRSSHMETVVSGGKRVTRTVTTLRYADGRTETKTDEREDDAPSSGDPFMLAGDGFGGGLFGIADAGARGGGGGTRRGGAGGRIGYF